MGLTRRDRASSMDGWRDGWVDGWSKTVKLGELSRTRSDLCSLSPSLYYLFESRQVIGR